MNSLDNLSIISLVLEADFMVKIVLFLLFMASIFSWALVFHKLFTIKQQTKYVDDFEKILSSGQVLDKIYDKFQSEKNNVIANIFISGLTEFRNLSSGTDEVSKSDAKGYIINSMNSEYSRSITKLEDNMDLLATIASVSPFVGLLGTVWGIINSFKSIAAAKNATLLVIAPSIAEALFATAVGLLVAIPASIFYNRTSNNINKLSTRLSDFISAFSVTLMKKM